MKKLFAIIVLMFVVQLMYCSSPGIEEVKNKIENCISVENPMFSEAFVSVEIGYLKNMENLNVNISEARENTGTEIVKRIDMTAYSMAETRCARKIKLRKRFQEADKQFMKDLYYSHKECTYSEAKKLFSKEENIF